MPDTENQLNQINHIVTLMLENRSFDNVLGWLYEHEHDRVRPAAPIALPDDVGGLQAPLEADVLPGGHLIALSQPARLASYLLSA